VLPDRFGRQEASFMEHEPATARTQHSARPPRQRPGVGERRQFQRLQAFEDAIAYRRARVTAPCRGCAVAEPGQKCDDHARDLELIDEYVHEIERQVRILDARTADVQDRPTLASFA
jgi:hypothetical protein